ncbi:hypothetical protein E8E14_000150 [Neopestalotiopsis sp. 37M]|nr:hypothetical protein E8E14_000150 [Neopestalotiopsis sp. 37M]
MKDPSCCGLGSVSTLDHDDGDKDVTRRIHDDEYDSSEEALVSRGGRAIRGQSRSTTSCTAGTKCRADEISDDNEDVATTSEGTASQITDLDDAPADDERNVKPYKAPAHLDEDVKSYVNNLMVGQPQYRFRPDSEYSRVERQNQATAYIGPARN